MTGNGGGAGGDGGNSNDNNGGGGSSNNSGGGNNNAGGFMAALNEDNRTYAQSKGWNDANAILGSYRNLETEYGRVKSNQKPAFPTSPAGYEFKLPEGIPADGFYDKGLASEFQVISHKAELTAKQAQTLHDWFSTKNHGLFTTAKTNQAKAISDRHAAANQSLAKDWGNPDTPGHKRAAEMARRTMAHLDPDLKAELTAFGIIQTNDKGEEIALSAPILRALAKAGSRMFAEDDLFGAPSQTENPFDPAKPNTQKQGELVRKNPELARTLIQAAGPKVVEAWGWWLNRK